MSTSREQAQTGEPTETGEPIEASSSRSEPSIVLSHPGDDIARITLNRPKKRNALDKAARAALLAALDDCRSGVSVVIIDGAGGTFCSGMDLNQLTTGNTDDEDELNESWLRIQEAIRNHSAIVIASVQGYALGGGSTLINTCDLAVLAEDAQIGMPEMGFGFYPGLAGPAAQLRLTSKRAAWLVLTAKRIDGRTAVEWGMANIAVPAAEVETQTLALARHIAQFDPVALEWAKRALWQIPMQISDFRAALQFGAYVNAQIHQRTSSHRESLLGFAQGKLNPGQGSNQ